MTGGTRESLERGFTQDYNIGSKDHKSIQFGSLFAALQKQNCHLSRLLKTDTNFSKF